MKFSDIRNAIAALADAEDGTVHQAILDAGYTVGHDIPAREK